MSHELGFNQLPVWPAIDAQHILSRLIELSKDEPLFIHVGGVSAAGKSTVARVVANSLPDAQVLSIDRYLIPGLYRPDLTFNHSSPDPSRPYIGGIDPKIWELDLMDEHLSALRQNNQVNVPLFDETIKDRIGYQPFNPSRFIILEGGHSFDARFRGGADYKILVEAPFHDRLMRKIVRTSVLYGRNDIDEVIDRYCTKDEPVWQIYKSEHESLADQIVQNYRLPEQEYETMAETKNPADSGVFWEMLPRSDYGSSHPFEQFGIVEKGAGQYNVRYIVGEKRLVELPVPETTVNLLLNYYSMQ